MADFPRFFLETNQISTFINDRYELTRALDVLIEAGYMLSKIRRCPSAVTNDEFGTRSEHRGQETLFMFLESKGVNIKEWTETHKKA